MEQLQKFLTWRGATAGMGGPQWRRRCRCCWRLPKGWGPFPGRIWNKVRGRGFSNQGLPMNPMNPMNKLEQVFQPERGVRRLGGRQPLRVEDPRQQNPATGGDVRWRGAGVGGSHVTLKHYQTFSNIFKHCQTLIKTLVREKFTLFTFGAGNSGDTFGEIIFLIRGANVVSQSHVLKINPLY